MNYGQFYVNRVVPSIRKEPSDLPPGTYEHRTSAGEYYTVAVTVPTVGKEENEN